jgi:hypothetical protein
MYDIYFASLLQPMNNAIIQIGSRAPIWTNLSHQRTWDWIPWSPTIPSLRVLLQNLHLCIPSDYYKVSCPWQLKEENDNLISTMGNSNLMQLAVFALRYVSKPIRNIALASNGTYKQGNSMRNHYPISYSNSMIWQLEIRVKGSSMTSSKCQNLIHLLFNFSYSFLNQRSIQYSSNYQCPW